MKMRYFIITLKWSERLEKQVTEIAGEFTNYVNARLFRDAYNANYNANAYIIDEYELLNR